MIVFSYLLFQKESESGNRSNSNNITSQKSRKDTIKMSFTELRKKVAKDEIFCKDHYNSVQESLAMFKDDPLVYKPGKILLKHSCKVLAQ